MLSRTRFSSDLEWSKSVRQETDLDTVRLMVPGCARLDVASVSDDKLGIDYKATLRGGAVVNVDAKNRRKGCSKYWRHGPEVALEFWSVMPGGLCSPRAGWTLDESKQTDLVLFQWDLSDTDEVYLVSFHLLRASLIRFADDWGGPSLPTKLRPRPHPWCRVAEQDNGRYTSQCVFVPVSMVEVAVAAVSRGRRGPSHCVHSPGETCWECVA